MSLQFERAVEFEYDVLQPVAPRIRRIVARNPSPYTLHGTGTYVVGYGRVAGLDPGPADTAHIDALLAALGSERVESIVVTHTHTDHSPGAALLAARTGTAIMGCAPHRRYDESFTGEAGGDLEYRPDHPLQDGECIGGPDWTLEAVATPGHTANHLCFCLREERVLFSGDHVMGWSTTVVSPPDGDMTQYMTSLRQLMKRRDARYWPTHGPAIDSPQNFVRALHGHRLTREAMILDRLRGGIDTIAALVDRIYVGLDTRLVRAARHTTWAHLIKLVNEDRVIAQPAATLEAIYRAN